MFDADKEEIVQLNTITVIQILSNLTTVGLLMVVILSQYSLIY